MSIRGKRSHSDVRRSVTPLASASVLVDLGAAETPLADADQLMSNFRVRAYAEARQRQRQATVAEAIAHWGLVANLIARRRDGSDAGESSTRSDLDAPGRRGRERGVRPADRFFEVDPLDELERILAVRPQRFRLQFFGVGADQGPTVLAETEILAADVSSAIREAVEARWPPRAAGLRLLDLEGQEIFERLKADLR
jgi:hypothetical protein